MKVLVGIVALIMTAQTNAIAAMATTGNTIVCMDAAGEEFSVQLTLGNEIENGGGFFAPKIYEAEFTSLTGPRIKGETYKVQVTKHGITTRLKSGYALTAEIPDGSHLNVEEVFDVSGGDFGSHSFTAVVSNWNHQNLSFKCGFNK